MSEIKAGDTLADIRRSGNLYVPFGTEEIRLVEDIHTGDWQYIWTDGTVVLALLDSPGRASTGSDAPDANKGQIKFAEVDTPPGFSRGECQSAFGKRGALACEITGGLQKS